MLHVICTRFVIFIRRLSSIKGLRVGVGDSLRLSEEIVKKSRFAPLNANIVVVVVVVVAAAAAAAAAAAILLLLLLLLLLLIIIIIIIISQGKPPLRVVDFCLSNTDGRGRGGARGRSDVDN